MGGACQHDWEHCVPKLRHASPRISITYRYGADRRPSEGLAPPVRDANPPVR